MAKRKKSGNQTLSSLHTSSPSLNMTLELDNRALRAKNGQLVQTVAKLQQEKTQQQSQIASLQEEYFKLNSKFVNLKNIFSTIDATTKVWFPKFVELSQMFTKVMRLCTVGIAVTNLNKDTRTQAVKPHIVNGHVLHNPTITLSRLSDNGSHTPPRRSTNHSPSPRRSANPQESLNSAGPSTSRISDRQENQIDNQNNENAGISRVTYYSRRPTLDMQSINMENLQEEDNDDDDLDEPDEEDEEEEQNDNFCSRLLTIQEEEEEDYTSPSTMDAQSRFFADRVREVRIYIDPLPSDYLNPSRTLNTSSGNISMSPQPRRRPCKKLSSSSELSDSMLDSSGTLVNESINSPKRSQIRNDIVKQQMHSFRMSPTKRKTRCFDNPRSYAETTDDLQLSTSDLRQNVESRFISDSLYSERVSVLHNMPSCSMSNIEDSCSNCTLENSKSFIMKNLGLETNGHHVTTSTPLKESSGRSSSRKNKFIASPLSAKKISPMVSHITKRRGGRSSDKKRSPKWC